MKGYLVTLLLIDDDQLLRTQIRFSIEDMFDTIYEASNIAQSLDYVENKLIDVALIDLALENEFDGAIIARKTLAKNIKTIMFTANLSHDIIKDFIKDGVFDYLNKPIDMPLLIAALNRAILFAEKENELKKENIYHLQCNVDVSDGIKNSLLDVEKSLLVKILEENNFNIYKTAKLLNTKRENIYYFIKKYNLSRD